MTEDTIEIIKMLRVARLGWIADELIEAIALGKQTAKEFREPGSPRTSRATAIEPLTPQQEMDLVVETLAQYFLLMPAAWQRARSRFADQDTFSELKLPDAPSWLMPVTPPSPPDLSVKLGITADGEEEEFQAFSDAFHGETQAQLTRVLRQLWPYGSDDFDRRFVTSAQETEP